MAQTNTISCTIHFYGTGKDSFGMPDPFIGFFVVASPWHAPGSGVASVVALTLGAQEPNPMHTISENGGPEGALSDALTAIRKVYAGKGLGEHTNCPAV